MSKIADILLSSNGKLRAIRLPVSQTTTKNTVDNSRTLSQFIDHLSKDELRALSIKLGLAHIVRPDDGKHKYLTMLNRLVATGSLRLDDVLDATTVAGSKRGAQAGPTCASNRDLQSVDSHLDNLLLLESEDASGYESVEDTDLQLLLTEEAPPLLSQSVHAQHTDVSRRAKPRHRLIRRRSETQKASGARQLPKRVAMSEFMAAPALDEGVFYEDSDIDVDLSDCDSEKIEAADCSHPSQPPNNAANQILEAKALLRVMPASLSSSRKRKRVAVAGIASTHQADDSQAQENAGSSQKQAAEGRRTRHDRRGSPIAGISMEAPRPRPPSSHVAAPQDCDDKVHRPIYANSGAQTTPGLFQEYGRRMDASTSPMPPCGPTDTPSCLHAHASRTPPPGVPVVEGGRKGGTLPLEFDEDADDEEDGSLTPVLGAR